MKIKRGWTIDFFLLLIVNLLFYLRTAAPTVTVDDSGDFTLGSFFLGIPHPPGYPLFVLLGRLFTLLPFGGIAFRVNLVAAVCGCIAVILVYLTVREVTSLRIPSLISALILTFSFTFWKLTTYAEVSTLTAGFILMIIYCFIRYRQSKNSGWLLLGFFLQAIGLGCHFTILLPIIWYLLFTGQYFLAVIFVLSGVYFKLAIKSFSIDQIGWTVTIYIIFTLLALALYFSRIISLKDRFRVRNTLLIIFIVVLGLSVFLYLPVRSNLDPEYNWGVSKNLKLFLLEVCRAQYGEINNRPRSVGLFLSQLGLHLKSLNRQFRFSAILLAILGIYHLLNKSPQTGGFILLFFSTPVLAFTWITNFELDPVSYHYVEVFLVPCFAIFTLFIGFGIELIFRVFREMNDRFAKCMAGVLFLIPVSLAIINLPQVSKRHYSYFHDYTRSALKLIRTPAILFMTGDPYTFTGWYLQSIKNYRKNVTLINTHMLDLPWYYQMLMHKYPEHVPPPPEGFTWKKDDKNLLIENIILKKYRTTAIYSLFNELVIPEKFSFQVYGLIYEVVPPGKIFSKSDLLTRSRTWLLVHLRNLTDKAELPDIFCKEVLLNISNAHYNLGVELLNQGYPELAETEFRETLRLDTTNSDNYRVLGRVLLQLNRFREAIQTFEQGLALDRNDICMLDRLGYSYLQLKNYDRAGEIFRKVLEINPNYVNSLVNLGYSLYFLGNIDEARKCASRAMAVAPSRSEPVILMARINLVNRKYRQARALAERALRMVPGSKEARKLLDEIDNQNAQEQD